MKATKKIGLKYIFCILLVLLAFRPVTMLAADNLLKYSVVGTLNLSAKEVAPSMGGLVSIKLKGNLRVETGYRWDWFAASEKTEMIWATNMTFYHTLPLGLSYSIKNFDVIVGPSLHYIGYANTSIYRVYTYEGKERFGFLDEKMNTDRYRKLFFTLNGTVRYNFMEYYAIGVTYGYGISDQLKNALFNKPFHSVSLSFYLRLNHELLH